MQLETSRHAYLQVMHPVFAFWLPFRAMLGIQTVLSGTGGLTGAESPR